VTYFVWAEDMSVGSALLDCDHRRLVDLVNELHTSTTAGAGRDIVGSILERLITYTREHFQREEHHMEQLRYSKIIEHKRQHQELLGKVLELRSRFDAGQITVAAQVSALLRDWLSVHIRREDKQYLFEMVRNAAKDSTPPA